MTKQPDKTCAVTLAKGSDWQGVYIDGILTKEDHRISGEDLLQIICSNGKKVTVAKIVEVDDDFLEEWGSTFPEQESDLQTI